MNSLNKIRFIHLGDIHIQDSRRDEFAQVFNKLYASIKNDIAGADCPTIIALCGDVFDSKTKVSAVNISDVQNFLTNLQNLAPTVMIPGNHDLNMNKPGGLDLLSPIVQDSANLSNLTYWRKSGIYQMDQLKYPQFQEISFIISAPDDVIIQREVELPNNKFLIGMMHEEICGATAFGYSFSGARFDGTKVRTDEFNGINLVMLGHIHQRQKLTERSGYCGSLLQRNFGEEHINHGYLIWDLTPTTIDCFGRNIENDNGYLIMKFQNDTNITQLPLPKKPNSIIIEYQNCNGDFIKEQISDIKKTYGGIKNVRCLDQEQKANKPKPMISNSNTIIKMNEDISSIEIQEELIRHLLVHSRYLEKIIELHSIKSTLYAETNSKKAATNKTRWKLKKLSFSNMFCFGPNNYIDFEVYKNSITGIVAPNRHGKSAIIDILCYVLFDELPRGDKENILNHTYFDECGNPPKYFEAEIEFEIDGKIGIINRHVEPSKKQPKTKFIFDNVNITAGTTSETYKKIGDIIGKYNDNISTVFALQDGPNDFIHMNTKDRKLLLTNLFYLNIFDEIHKEIKQEQLNLKNAAVEKIKFLNKTRGDLTPEKLKKINEQINQIENNILPNTIKIIETYELELTQLINSTKERLPIINEEVNSLTKEELTELNSLDNIDNSIDVSLLPYYEIIKIPVEKPTIAQPGTLLYQLLAMGGQPIKSDVQINDNLLNINPKELEKQIVQVQYNQEEHEKLLKVQRIDRKIYEQSINSIKNMVVSNVQHELNDIIVKYQNFQKIYNECGDRFRTAEIIKKFININDLSHDCQKCMSIKKIGDTQEIINQMNDCSKNMQSIKNKLDEYQSILEKYISDDIIVEQKLNEFNKNLLQIKENEKLLNYISIIKQYHNNKCYELILAETIKYEQYENALKIIKEKEAVNYIEKQKLFKRKEELRNKAGARKKLLEDKIQSARKYQIELERTYGQIKENGANMEKVLKNIEELQKDLDETIMQQEIYTDYRRVLDECTGIPMLLLKRNIATFTNAVNQILSQFTDMQIIMNEDFQLFVKCGDFHQTEPIVMSSGYQKFVIALACRVALANISTSPLLDGIIIDEGFASMDNENRELTIDFLNELSHNHELLFIISHLESLQAAMEHSATIERKKGTVAPYSYINNNPQHKQKLKSLPLEEFTKCSDDAEFYMCNYCNKRIKTIDLLRHKELVSHKKHLSG